MSVINKMLQDLQQRNALASDAETVLQQPLTASNQWQQPRKGVAKLLFGGGVLLLLLMYWWYSSAQPPQKSVAALTPLTALTLTASADDITPIPVSATASVADTAFAAVLPATDEQQLVLLAGESAHSSQNAAQATAERAANTISTAPAINNMTVSEVAASPSVAVQQQAVAPKPKLTIEPAPVSALQQEFELAVKAAATQQWQQALLHLSATEPVATFPAYFALKATVLQQQAEWAAALELYQQLLQLEPAHAGWNLAAGISAQQLNSNALAQRFYAAAWQNRIQLPAASQAYLQQQLSLMK